MSVNNVFCVIGKPGSGKSTIAQRMKAKLGGAIISVGNILKQIAKDASNPNWKEAQVIKSGGRVKDFLFKDIVIKAIKDIGNKDLIIFEGAPRTVEQVHILGKMFKNLEAIIVNADNETIFKRLSNRKVCSKCYQPKEKGAALCICGNKTFISRDDDTKKIIKKRIDDYTNSEKDIIKSFKDIKAKVTKITNP